MKKIRLYLFVLFSLILIPFCVFAQNVGINDSGTTPDNNAILDVQANDKGILIPRLTSGQRNAIQSPTNGLMIYNIDCNVFEYWNGNNWIQFPQSALVPSGAFITVSSNTVCSGTALNFTGNGVNGNIWNWTGPNGFASSLQNPVINNITVNASGDYILLMGNSCSSDISTDTVTITVETIPNAPTATIETGLGTTNFTANWSAVLNATEYYLDVATNNTFTNFVAGYSNVKVGNNTSHQVAGLPCGNTYYYRVRAVNNCGLSSNSNVITVSVSCFVCGSTFTDTRDGETYNTVQIGSQCWMAENLRYLPSVVGTNTGSATSPYYYVYGYNGTDVSIAKSQPDYLTLGVLYNWTAAT